MSPRSVLLVKGNYGVTGGPETLVQALVRELDRERFRPVVAMLCKPGAPEAPALMRGALDALRRDVPWYGLAAAPLAAAALGRLAREEDAALLHSHDLRSTLAAYLWTRVRPVPWVAHVHGWLGATHRGRWRLYERIEQRLVRRADRVVVGSRAALDEVHALGVTRAALVRNGVDPSVGPVDEATRARIRASVGAATGSIVVGMLGRLHPGKGQDVLLRAIARVRASGIDARGLIVGEGASLPELSSLSATLGLHGAVVLPGYCADRDTYLDAMDVVAVPSLKESLPLAALEAMRRGRPVVASRAGDLPDVIADGVSGMLVPPGDDAALADALARLARDPALRARLGAAAREAVVRQASAGAMTRAMEAVYAGVLGEVREVAHV
jgi:glycosyltransferase involved in cell wall biosynthesis